MMRIVPIVLLLLGLTSAWAQSPTKVPATAAKAEISVQQKTEDARYRGLAEELRCLVCQNQSLADSAADLALDLKREIREQIRTGKTDHEIMDYMVARYGDFVLYRPPLKGLTVLLWTAPVVLLLLGLFLLWRHLRQDQRNAQPAPDGASAVDASPLASGAASLAEPTPAEPAPKKWRIWLGTAAVLLLAIALYVLLGRPELISNSPQALAAQHHAAQQQAADAAEASEQPSDEQIKAMVQRLAMRLMQNPDDAQGWYRLGRSYNVLGRFADAARAYAKAEALDPKTLAETPAALLDYAKALAMTSDSNDKAANEANAPAQAPSANYQGKAGELVDAALLLAPNEPNVMLVAGLTAAHRGQHQKAIALWQALLQQVPPEHELHKVLKMGIEKMQSELK